MTKGPARSQQAPSVEARQRPTKTSSLKILVVDDEEALLALLRHNLEGDGYQCHTSAHGDDAWERYQRDTFDLVLLDWMLPGLSGIEILRRIRLIDSITPIIMLTARGEESERVRGLSTGANDYIVKPFSVPELLARVRVVLHVQETYHKRVLAFSRKHATKSEELVVDNAQDIREAILSKIIHDVANYSSNIEQIIEAMLGRQLGRDNAVQAIRAYSALVNMTVANLRYYVQGQPVKQTRINAHSVVLLTRDIFASTHQHEIRIKSVTGFDDPEIVTNKELLCGVLLGFLDNAARHGIPVRSKNERTGSSPPAITFGMSLNRETKKVVYSVTDEACGIPDTVKDRLFFEPISSDKGLGSGLYLSRQIALEMGWDVGFDKKRRRGAKFYLAIDRA